MTQFPSQTTSVAFQDIRICTTIHALIAIEIWDGTPNQTTPETLLLPASLPSVHHQQTISLPADIETMGGVRMTFKLTFSSLWNPPPFFFPSNWQLLTFCVFPETQLPALILFITSPPVNKSHNKRTTESKRKRRSFFEGSMKKS